MRTAEEILNHKGLNMVSVPLNTSLCETIKIMNKNQIGSILIQKEDNIVGIWTERNLMDICTEKDFDPYNNTIEKFMSKDILTAPHDANVYELMDKFLGKRKRHLLILKEGKFIGILSSGDVMRATMLEKDEELKKLNAMVSWDYYENWKWEKTKIPPIIHNEEGLRVDLK